MAFVTLLRQVSQIRNSGSYVDNTAPTLANYETNPTEIETDLNNIRSAIANLIDGQTNPWYTDLVTPSALETGSQRGVNDLNSALHAMEKQRRLRRVKLLVDVAVPAAVQATETLTTTGVVGNNETVTIGGQVYTYKTTLTPAANEVLIGASQADSMENLRRAINGDGVADTNYGSGTAVNAFVTATDTATTVVVTAIEAGTAGNTIAIDETLGNGSWGGAVTSLSGGVGDVVVLGSGELPTNTTAAVGAVTTLGTIVAHNNTFGTATLDEVAGLHALAPKNLVEIVNGATGDPILTSGGRRIWALLQSEIAGDGHTINITDQEAMLTFVVSNTTNDDLEIVDGNEIGGSSINYCYTERVRHEDLDEQDFLTSAAIDIGAGAVSVTQQTAFDGQGATAVNITNAVTWDLEGAGLVFKWRDDLEQDLVSFVEGSAGGTSQVNIHADVDEFDVDAIVNNFASGITARSGGTRPLQLGVNDGLVETTAGDMEVKAFAELVLNDTHMENEGTWTRNGVLLADSAAEVTAYDSAFGEVSIFAALVAANSSNTTRVIARATVTAASISATTNVTGGAGANISNVLTDYTAINNVGSFETNSLMDIYVGGVGPLAPDFTSGADYNPGDDVTEGDLKFNADLFLDDRIVMVTWF
jgi:hypothetical protein